MSRDLTRMFPFILRCPQGGYEGKDRGRVFRIWFLPVCIQQNKKGGGGGKWEMEY